MSASIIGSLDGKRHPRTTDLGLLLVVGLILGSGLGALLVRQGVDDWSRLLPVASVAAVALFVVTWTMVFRPQALAGPIPLAVLLSGVGMLFMVRLDPFIAAKQAVWLLVSAVVFALTERVAGRVLCLARYRYTWAALGLLLVALTFAFGTGPGGSKLWLNFGLFYFQPSEAMKILLALFLASYLADNALLLRVGKRVGPFTLPRPEYLGPLMAIVGVGLALLSVQGDLGPALIIFGSSVGMIYVATGRKNYVVASVALFVLGSLAAYALVPRVRVRFEAWLDPWQDPGGTGYQILQATYAVADGGIFGVGLGAGNPWLIPAAHTDMVFPALVEELGIAGGLALIMALLCYIWSNFKVSMSARDPFCRLLAAGLGLTTGLQAMAIIGGSLRLMPLTGVTVPFLSYGGSSLVVNFAALALMMAVSDVHGR
jgi:cell division protein FtsW (lipid II flippase)